MLEKVTPSAWLFLLLGAFLSSCGAGGKVELGTSEYRGPLEVTTQSLPPGAVGRPYQAQLTARGGAKPYTWSLPFAELPPGLSLNPATGLIKGTPTRAANYSFTVRVTDSTLLEQQTALALVEAPIEVLPLVIETASVPNGAQGRDYAMQFTASGGTPPYVWSVVEGLLPPDLSLDPATGILSGIPTLVGDYSFTLQVTDSATPPASANLRVRSSRPVQERPGPAPLSPKL
jgi:hypothetical protein